MPRKSSYEDIQAAVDAVRRHGGNLTRAAAELKLSRGGLQGRLRRAEIEGIRADVPEESYVDALKKEIKSLEARLSAAEKDRLTTAYVREKILGLAAQVESPAIPSWVTQKPPRAAGVPGVPCTMWSDWHWGERVSLSEIGGVNEFNLKIAAARARRLFDTTVSLLKSYTVNPDYPGIVVNLGGDMITGDIHEELTATNDAPVMSAVVDLFGVLVAGITRMADEFNNVFVPCVTGNHGRNTRKIQAKQRAFTNFDWLLYQLLDRHFQNDPRVTFLIPDGPDALYQVYNHRYLLTHGDQFRGGDGIIGPLGPITRGDNKKRSRNSQMGMDYDTLVVGHFHQLMMLPRLIVNGSLKGYDEYAFQGNFPFEPPAQALWFTHPDLGITISMPVYVERKKRAESAWVSIPRS